MKSEKAITIVLEWSSVGFALGAAVVALFKKDSAWYVPLLGFSITTLVSRWILHEKEWKRHKTDVDAALATIASEVRVSEALEERILIRVLQSITFKGAPIDDIFWIGYARMLMNDAQKDVYSALATAVQIRKSGKVPSDEKRYEVMELLMSRVRECSQKEYLGVAFEEELSQKKAHRFIFELPLIHAEQGVITRRLFVVRGEQVFRQLPPEKRKALREQAKCGCELRWYRMDDSCPPNFGIYGDIAIGEMSADQNVIDFNLDRVRDLRTNHWDRCWKSAQKLTEEVLR